MNCIRSPRRLHRLASGVHRAAAFFAAAFVVSTCSLFAEPLRAESLTSRLPAGALATVEIADAGRSIEALKSSEALSQLLASEPYQAWSASPDGRKFRGGRALLEGQMGLTLWDAATQLFGHRAILAAYPPGTTPQPEVVLVLQFAKDETGSLLREKLEPWAEIAAENLIAATDGDWWGLETKDGKAFLSVSPGWCVISNARVLRDDVIACIEQPPVVSLASVAAWQTTSVANRGALSQVKGVVDIEAIRKLLAQPRLLPSKTDNPLASLLFGGSLEVAAVAPAVVANLEITDTSAALRLKMLAGAADVDAAHRTLLQPTGTTRAMTPSVPRQLAGATLCCEWAEWYRQRDQLLQPQVLPEFDKFETGLSNLIPGKDFAEDILALLRTPISLVTASQTYPHLDGRPGLQLPAFGLVLELNDPQRGADVFQLFFQTLGTIINIEAGKNGRQPWVMSSENYGGVQVSFAKYLDRPQGEDLPIVYNFQPAAAMVGDRYVAASSLELCRDLIDSFRQNPRPTATPVPVGRNFELFMAPETIATLLSDNRAVITARGLQQGKTLERATRELDLVVELLRRMSGAQITSEVSADALEWRIEGGWK